jgi:uncharacterized Zn-binding protein involved in type VI secretion
MLERAARVGDPIEHSNIEGGGWTGLIVGIAIGAAIVGAAVLCAPAVGAVLVGGAIVGATAAGASATAVALGVAAGASTIIGAGLAGEGVGERLGKKSHHAAGDIIDGASTVFTGEGMPKAARITDPLKCHSGKRISQGSESVFIENHNASRKGDGTECGGKILDGCATVLIGGNPVGDMGAESVSGLLKGTKTTLDVTNTALGFVTARGWVAMSLQATGAAAKAYAATGAPGAKSVGYFGGAAVAAGKLATGNVTNVASAVTMGVGQGTAASNYFNP